MRPKIVLTTLGILTVVLTSIFVVQQRPGEPRKNENVKDEFATTKVSRGNPVQQEISRSSTQSSEPNLSPARTSTASTNSVEERINALEELGAGTDPNSLQKIIAELGDANPEIRQAALDAVIQFGNRDAIPLLKELAANTENPREKVELLDAAEFLELPSFGEVRAQQVTNARPTNPTTR